MFEKKKEVFLIWINVEEIKKGRHKEKKEKNEKIGETKGKQRKLRRNKKLTKLFTFVSNFLFPHSIFLFISFLSFLLFFHC